MQLEFRLLGELAVVADGRRLDLGGPRQRSVLALLLLQRDRVISTALLADKLWPDDQPLSAIKTVQVYVSRLRDVLGAEAGRLTTTSSGYRLSVADDEFDVARFERGLRQAREASASGGQERARATLEAALAEWSGPALGDLADERFARSEADRLDELRLQAIEELYQARIDVGNGREAIAELRGLVADEPGRETLWRLLMLALYTAGRQAEALEAYQDARRYLDDELGLDPSPELQGLERAILNQEALLPARREIEPAPAATNGAPPDEPPTSADGGETTAQRRRRMVTVLRAGSVGAADDADPEILDARGRRAEEVVRRAIERHGGIIDHADQHGVTAVFGLAVAREDDALRAVRAAAELRGDAGSAPTVARVVLSVGVATGEVLAGAGEAQRLLVTGAPLHLAGVLAERAAGDEVLLALETERLVRGSTTTEPVSLDGEDDSRASGAVRLVAVTEAEPIERRTTTPFVGRVADLAALAAAFERVAGDAVPGLATVTGAPGVGKSRLVAEALSRIAERARVLRSRCLPYGEGITYWPVRELVQAATGIEHGEPRDDAIAKLDAVVGGVDRADLVRASLASIMGLTDDPVPGEEIAWAVRRFVEVLAAERPLVLVVDDLQWAEPVLVDLLDHVLDLGRGPILLIAMSRPELEDVRPDWLARSSLALVRLDALGETDAAALLDHLAPELPPGELRSRILASAEGNPLFVEQFVAYATDEALAGRPTLDERTAVDLPIPPTIGALLAARLDRLPEVERHVLERASVVGRTFWTGALTELLPDDERRHVAGRLARLARRDLIRPQPSDFADEDAYRFRHLLIRDAAYASLPKRDRSELHERFAAWLERSNEDREIEVEEILGYHLEQAYHYRDELGPLDDDAVALGGRASTRLASAGRRALARGDFPAAANLLERAARLLDEAEIDRQRLLTSAGEAYMEIGEFGTAEEILTQAVAGARTLGDRPVSIAADLIRIQLHVRSEASTSIDDVMTQTELGIAELAAFEDPTALARAWRLLELANGVTGRYKAAGDANAKALEYARLAGDRVLEKRLYSSAAQVALSGPLPAPDGIARCEELIRMAEGDRRAQGVTLAALAHLRAMVGDLDAARSDYRRGRLILEELGLRFDASLISIDSGPVELLAGDPVAAEAELRKDYDALDAMGERNYISSIAGLLAETLYRQGRIAEAAEQAAFCESMAAPSDVFSQHLWRGVRGKLLAGGGAHDEGVKLAASGVEQTRTSDDIEGQGNALMFLAEAQAAAGRGDDAARSAAEARVLFEAKGNVVSAARAAAFASPAEARRPRSGKTVAARRRQTPQV